MSDIEYGKRITEESIVKGSIKSRKIWEMHSFFISNPISMQTELKTAGDMVALGRTYDMTVRIYADKLSGKLLRVEKKWIVPNETT